MTYNNETYADQVDLLVIISTVWFLINSREASALVKSDNVYQHIAFEAKKCSTIKLSYYDQVDELEAF